MVNLLSNDVSRFNTSFLYHHYLWIGPLQALISLPILYHTIGPSCLVGFSILILFIPLQGWIIPSFKIHIVFIIYMMRYFNLVSYCFSLDGKSLFTVTNAHCPLDGRKNSHDEWNNIWDASYQDVYLGESFH